MDLSSHIALPFQLAQATHPNGQRIGAILKELLPVNSSKAAADEARFCLESLFPKILWIEGAETTSLTLVSYHKKGASSYFRQRLTHYLSESEILSFSCTDFRIPRLLEETLTLIEVTLPAPSWETFRHALPYFEQEFWMGIPLAQRGATLSDTLLRIKKRFAFGDLLFSQMRKTLTLLSDTFKEHRSDRHLARLIAYQTHFHGATRCTCRPLQVKVEGAGLATGILVHLKLKPGEIFGKRHLLEAIRSRKSDAKAIEGSFFAIGHTFYLEIKGVGDLQALKQTLPEAIEGYVERPLNRLLVPPNQEEVMRHMAILAQEIRYVGDIPQGILSFHEQRLTTLVFHAVVVRVVKPPSPSFAELLEANSIRIGEWQEVGLVRGRFPKEAALLEFEVEKGLFIRADASVDLYRAREHASDFLTQAIGEWRDYYGGLMESQHNLLKRLKSETNLSGILEERLAEEFFHSLSPGLARHLLGVDLLVRLFNLMRKAMAGRTVFVDEDDASLLVAIWRLNEEAPKQGTCGSESISAELRGEGGVCIGLLYRALGREEKEECLERCCPELDKPLPSCTPSSDLLTF